MKLLSQFEHVDKATPFARRDEGKISAGLLAAVNISGLQGKLPDGIAQGTGPQLAPKASMYTSNMATLAQPFGRCAGQFWPKRPTRMAMIMCAAVMKLAPPTSKKRRPSVSIVHTLVETPTS